ncbi:hypothetical protein IB292_03000 [Vibrio parahaemolyticus]|uniref:Uncharacterized protein n=2 Tax=Vibrio harveyi group TaxID=717610 RepID=A0A9Q3YGG5_VIBPH|nr:hypothetical protein [Vibrio parahaemolyticus]MCC3803999.1 hypothetical protein [Vibrio parahaemolyticus]CAH1598373.1 membrane hypothetical protein [Vibrio jasicida]CAH1601841.1 membrane hypothetical protein [Vibrio jasicida]
MKRFALSYFLYLVFFHVSLLIGTLALQNLLTTLEITRSVLAGQGLIYMLMLFFPIANSGLSSLKVFLVSMPILVFCLAMKVVIANSILGLETYTFSLESMKEVSEAIVSIMVFVTSAAISYEIARRVNSEFRFFSK